MNSIVPSEPPPVPNHKGTWGHLTRHNAYSTLANRKHLNQRWKKGTAKDKRCTVAGIRAGIVNWVLPRCFWLWIVVEVHCTSNGTTIPQPSSRLCKKCARKQYATPGHGPPKETVQVMDFSDGQKKSELSPPDPWDWLAVSGMPFRAALQWRQHPV
mmetsp:Transcript_17746/g.30775  ORF Transcript_17746/g.30775 Transcript_17746/m.30775 type:complete len:156 (-) Transcript_17746:946-1413(-)